MKAGRKNTVAFPAGMNFSGIVAMSARSIMTES